MKQEMIQKLQFIFEDPIVNVRKMEPGHDSTNDVYAVLTQRGRFIVKIVKDPSMKGLFWKGLHLLFGTTHEISIKHQQGLSEHLNRFNGIPVPKVIKAQWDPNNPLNKPYIVMEVMPGNPVAQESDLATHITQDPDIAYQLGAFLTQLHKQIFSFFGNLELEGLPLSEFPQRLASTMEFLAKSKKAKEDKEVQALLPYFLVKAKSMPAPTSAGLIMLDLWPSQFLANEKGFTSLIDIESYVIGPIEMELVLLELWLKKRSKFKEAYMTAGVHWPDYEATREIYRFFLYLLYDCPPAGLSNCLDSKGKFPQGDRIRSRLGAPKPRPGGSFFTPPAVDDD